MNRNHHKISLRCLILFALAVSCISGCRPNPSDKTPAGLEATTSGGSACSDEESRQVIADMICRMDEKHPPPPPRDPNRKPLPEEPERAFTDPQALALADAIKRGDLNEIDRLLEAKVDVSLRGNDEITPLLWALMCRQPGSFRHLLEKGARTDGRFLGEPCLFIAAGLQEPGSEAYVKALLNHGADPHWAYSSGTSPMNGETALFPAARAGNIETIRLLIRAGAEIDRQSSMGTTPLKAAAFANQYQAVYELLEQGADPLVPSKELDKGLFFVLAGDLVNEHRTPTPWRDKVVDWLKEHGYDLEPAMARARKGRESTKRQLEEQRKLREMLQRRHSSKKD